MDRVSTLLTLLGVLIIGVLLGALGQATGFWTAGRSAASSAPPPHLLAGSRDENTPQGRWHRAPDLEPPPGASSEELAMLLAVPYLSGTHEATARTGVTIHDAERAHPGFNLYTSGHAPAAFLVDMDGNEHHRWEATHDSVWPELASNAESEKWHYWRRVHLLEDGGLLAIFEGVGLVRLDIDSQILWSHRGGEHHDLCVDESGRIYVLGRRPRQDEEIHGGGMILEDLVFVLSPTGELQREISLLDAVRRSPHEPLLRHVPASADIFHTNTLERFDGDLADRSRLFREGNLLLSMREIDTIAILDPERQEIVWSLMGKWRRQHQPSLLLNGNLLLFDNQFGPQVSRVLEFDPFDQDVEWSYAGSDQRPFYSDTCGSAQRLPNGNTLITESDRGRAFELTADGTIVWEFANPHRAGERDELVATLFEVVRMEALPPALLDRQIKPNER